MGKNKVLFGLDNVHYAFMLEDSLSGAPAYEKPKPIKGAVSFSISPEVNETPFYADNMLYYHVNQNSGYSGDLEMAKLPDEFVAEALGWHLDANGALIEVADTEQKKFALMAEISGDAKGRRVVFYCCTGSAPSQDLKTNTNSREIAPETMTINITPIDMGIELDGVGTALTKASLEYNPENAAIWRDFFKQVYIPEITRWEG